MVRGRNCAHSPVPTRNLSGAPGSPLFARGGSEWPSVSATGRYVFFRSDATDLVAQNNIRATQLYLRDTCAQVVGACTPHTTLVTVDSEKQDASPETHDRIYTAPLLMAQRPQHTSSVWPPASTRERM